MRVSISWNSDLHLWVRKHPVEGQVEVWSTLGNHETCLGCVNIVFIDLKEGKFFCRIYGWIRDVTRALQCKRYRYYEFPDIPKEKINWTKIYDNLTPPPLTEATETHTHFPLIVYVNPKGTLKRISYIKQLPIKEP